MTLPEWMLEAEYHISQTPEGRAAKQRDVWQGDAELSDEEWWEKHGSAKN